MCLVLYSAVVDVNEMYCIVNVQVDDWNCRHDVVNSTGGGQLAVIITNFDLKLQRCGRFV